MKTILGHCPACGNKLTATNLHCDGCGMNLQNDFELSPFDYLSQSESDFLFCFLRTQGNMKALCGELGMSFPTAKRQYEKLMIKLGISEQKYFEPTMEEIPMNFENATSRPSEMIRNMLFAAGGKATVRSLEGKEYEIFANPDKQSFSCDALPLPQPYTYAVFDVIVRLLIAKGGRAEKGWGRNYRLGEPKCDETTVLGYISKHYNGKQNGDSVFDPIFVLAAILDWAGIARNCRGYIELTPEYRRLLKDEGER